MTCDLHLTLRRDATERCKIVDKHMLLLAPKHMETKFVKVAPLPLSSPNKYNTDFPFRSTQKRTLSCVSACASSCCPQ